MKEAAMGKNLHTMVGLLWKWYGADSPWHWGPVKASGKELCWKENVLLALSQIRESLKIGGVRQLLKGIPISSYYQPTLHPKSGCMEGRLRQPQAVVA